MVYDQDLHLIVVVVGVVHCERVVCRVQLLKLIINLIALVLLELLVGHIVIMELLAGHSVPDQNVP